MIESHCWKQWLIRALVLAAALPGALGAFPHLASAAERQPEAAIEETETGSGSLGAAVRAGALGLAAALVMAAAAWATARVQAAIGSGGTGALAEKPDLFISIVILIAIPETILVLGFVMALLLWSVI